MRAVQAVRAVRPVYPLHRRCKQSIRPQRISYRRWVEVLCRLLLPPHRHSSRQLRLYRNCLDCQIIRCPIHRRAVPRRPAIFKAVFIHFCVVCIVSCRVSCVVLFVGCAFLLSLFLFSTKFFWLFGTFHVRRCKQQPQRARSGARGQSNDMQKNKTHRIIAHVIGVRNVNSNYQY